jgi:hypothetical protein
MLLSTLPFDQAVPTVVPTILSRKSCIILTMLHLRVVITAKELTIFDSVGSEDSWLKGVFIWSAEVSNPFFSTFSRLTNPDSIVVIRDTARVEEFRNFDIYWTPTLRVQSSRSRFDFGGSSSRKRFSEY